MEEVTPKANLKVHKFIFGFSQGNYGNLTFNWIYINPLKVFQKDEVDLIT
jgi:hypothetical protein